jgi:hypothetical protein
MFGMIADAWNIHAAFYFLAGTIILANLLVVFVPRTEPAKAA